MGRLFFGGGGKLRFSCMRLEVSIRTVLAFCRTVLLDIMTGVGSRVREEILYGV